MTISVLATKCRYCGEDVGKPKEEQRELSVNDLGGENVHHRAPSGSVMEALESFRLEDASGEEGQTNLDDELTGVPGIDSLDDDYNTACTPDGASARAGGGSSSDDW